MNRLLVAFLVLVGCLNSLWIDVGAEYMPYDTIEAGVSDAQGTIVLDVYGEDGESAYHEAREAARGADRYYYSYETFEFSLPSGEYTLSVRDGVDSEEMEFRVTSIGLVAVVGPEGKGLLLRKEDGSAIGGGGITLEYLDGENDTRIVEAVSGEGGMFAFESGNLTKISAEHLGEKAEIAVSGGYYPYYYEDYYWYPQYTGYSFSDKELYQPGETVHFSSVIFRNLESAYETVEGEVDVEIRGPEYDVVYSKPVGAVNSRISLDFALGDEAALGWYSVSMMKNDSYVGWYSFEVQEYKRPEIRVSLEPEKERFVVNETIGVDVGTKYYFGQDADAQVDFEIYTSPYYWGPYYLECMCIPYYGKVKVAEGTVYSEDGVGRIEWDGANETGMYEVIVKVTDESEIVSEESVVVAVLERENLDILVGNMEVNESGIITILSYDENEEPVEVSGKVEVYYEDYAYPLMMEYDEFGNEVLPPEITPEFEAEFESEGGIYSFEFTPEETGQYLVYVETDTGVEEEEYFYVSEWNWWNWNYIEVALDKEEYSKGERIGLTVTSPVGGRLVAISAGETLGIEFFEIAPGVNGLEMEATGTSSMSFYVIEEGTRYGGYENYMVRGEEWVEVGILHGGEYGPRDTATIRINASRNGRSSDATASIAIVDQSIVDLSGAQWNDIYSYFYGYPLEDYSILFSWEDSGSYWRMYDDVMYLEETGEMFPDAVPGEGAETRSKEEILVREKFIESALWIPYVMLEDGEKDVIWHIPDTLTTWNITVVASEGTNVGMGTSSVLVTKDVIGRLSPPSALVVGDAAAIPATIFNYGEERVTFRVSLETGAGVEVLGSPVRYLSLEPGESVTAYFPVKAFERGESELLLWVEGGEGDAVKLPIEVKELGVKIVEGEAGVALDSETLKYESEEDAEITLSLHSSVLSSAFESLDYLVNYPYGCIEQTMSGFLPDVVLVYALDELGLEYGGEENVSALIDEGLSLIYSHQNADGSWGWFSGNDERISAYVMDGLWIAKNAGVHVDEEVYGSGLEWLEDAESPYALFVLNRITEGKADSYPEGEFGALSRCMDGECGELVSLLDCFGDHCRLEYGEGYSWYHSDTELTSYALEALAENGEMEYARKCVNWLMLEKRGRYWRSTKDTARTVLALTEYAKVSGELRSDYVARVYLDGEKLYEGRMGEKGEPSVELSLEAGEHEIRIEKDGFGPLYYGLFEEYYSMELPEGEIEVEREYERTVSRVGEEIKVRLAINGSGEYVAIEDPIPLGAEIVMEEPGRYWYYYGWYRMEAREDRAVFFLDSLDGETEFEYTLRVTHKGDFTALPTHAYSMYAPEHSGYSEFEHFVFYEKAYIEPYVTEFNTTLNVYWEGDGPALLRVNFGGTESEYEVLPGESTFVFEGSGELSYSFESEEEYFEVESVGAEEDAGGEEEGDLIIPIIVALVVLGAFLYLWKRK
jgi:uncharacterized protein YfaS (alpha-2-macroglobulin family)